MPHGVRRRVRGPAAPDGTTLCPARFSPEPHLSVDNPAMKLLSGNQRPGRAPDQHAVIRTQPAEADL